MEAASSRRKSLGLTLACFAFLAAVADISSMRPEVASAKPLPARPAQPRRDWPLFGGTVHRNMVNPFEKNIPAAWNIQDKQKNIKWVARLGTTAFCGPVIAGGKVFIGTNNQQPRDPKHVDARGRPIDLGVLMCFRESDGQFLWQAVHRKLPQGRANDWPLLGLVSVPAVEDGRLYYVSNRSELICVDTRDGKAIWRLDMIGTLGVFPHNLAVCSPLIVGDLVFVVTGNGVDQGHIHIPAPQAPSFLAVHKRTGKVIWQDNSPTAKLLKLAPEQRGEDAVKRLWDRGELVMHGQWSNPAYGEAAGQSQVIFPGGDGWLRAFEPQTGKLLWKFDCNPTAAVYRLGGRGTRSDFLATPAIHNNRLYIGVGQDPEHENGVGHLWCVDLVRATAKGRTNKDHDVSPVDDNFDPQAAVNRNSALGWHFGGMLSRAAQQKAGRKYAFGRTLSTCAIHDGLCYAADSSGYIYCLDAVSGRLYWHHDTRAAVWSSPYWIDGRVYLGNDAGEVFVFAHGKQKKLLNTVDMDGQLRGCAVAANGTLYFAVDGRLYAISAGGRP